jgi:hypothetical protein
MLVRPLNYTVIIQAGVLFQFVDLNQCVDCDWVIAFDRIERPDSRASCSACNPLKPEATAILTSARRSETVARHAFQPALI